MVVSMSKDKDPQTRPTPEQYTTIEIVPIGPSITHAKVEQIRADKIVAESVHWSGD